MTSSLPIVRQISWFSVVPQLAVLSAIIAIARTLDTPNPVAVGVACYLALSLTLRTQIPSAHRRGIKLFKQEKFYEAVPQFEISYEFFSRHAWIDRWRAITLLSSSRTSYKEMALLNVAFCLGQCGQSDEAIKIYKRALVEFPGSKLAETSIRMLEGLAQQRIQPDGHASGAPAANASDRRQQAPPG